MRSVAPVRCVFLLLLAALVQGCSSAPDWVAIPPGETPGEIFFTGSGSDTDGDTAKAEEAAENSLIVSVTRYLGVRITSESTVEARATLTEYEERITELIRQESAAYVSDLKIVDKHIVKNRSGTVVVHLLGAYDRAALSAEKERLAELFAERIEAVAGPEREGDRYTESGNLYLAAVSYLASATAALAGDIDNAQIVVDRVLRKAAAAVSRMAVRKLSWPQSAAVGREMPQGFSVAVSGPSGGISEVLFDITWRETKPGGRAGLSSITARTGQDGVVVFDHPAPGTAGDAVVVFSLSFASQLQPLKFAAGKEDELVRGFEQTAAEKTLEFRFRVLSDSMRHPTAVYFVDILDDGSMRTDSDTGAGLYRALAEAGFPLVPFTGDRRLADLDAPGFIKAVREEGLTEARRVVFGAARVVDAVVDGGVHLVSVEGELIVVDLDGGNVLYSLTSTRTARGRNRGAAVTAAFRELGDQLGAILVKELP